MGVPKFFRYISERYPCLSESVKEHQLSEYDNMYLDMNGIVHTCSHPDDANPHFRITEEAIFIQIFHYLSYLFQLIRPNKVFFMAIDGVAPRAKMNQQRGRRFRTAREAEQMEELARSKGEVLPTEKRFDSNCITPGTVFMANLHEQLKYFVKHKISTDKAWSKCRIVLSGHETPGEGEHKIMDYIRYIKAQPDYDPNTRHCLYGLDADLIMLGLCTHEPNFSLLREEVKFGRNAQRACTPDEKTFFLLHLSLMRSYLEQEFISLKNVISFGYDLEKVIDDWVLLGFLVGNDFIPPLPYLHIHTDALPLLYETYKRVIVQLDGYINEGGILNLRRFEVFMKELAKEDVGFFKEGHSSLRGLDGESGARDSETFGVNAMDIKNAGPLLPSSFLKSDLKALIAATDLLTIDGADNMGQWQDLDDGSDEESIPISEEFLLHRRDYYINKLKYSEFTPDVAAEQAECYVTAIQWILHYYYQGCVSWSWFYPHHYAPYISDIVKFKDMNLTYDMAYPFKPFEQLLAVLPAASKELLPDAFHFLMTSDKSPIYHFYPEDFETDLNGKRNDWEAVVLIPFIDEGDLLSAMKPCYEKLTDEENKRNSHGPMFIYDYTIEDLGEFRAPAYFPKVVECHAKEVHLVWQDLVVAPERVVRGALPNPLKNAFFPGIPTLKHLNFKTRFSKERVRVFDQPSRSDNAILEICHGVEEEPAIEEVASSLLGKIVWVGWPHLNRAKVISVSNQDVRLYYNRAQDDSASAIEDERIDGVLKEYSKSARDAFYSHRRTIIDHQMSRLGIDVGDVATVVEAVCLKGYKYVIANGGNLVVEAIWCTVSSPYPLQTVISKLEVAPEMCNRRYRTLQDAMPPGDTVFITTGPYYGCMSEIVDTSSTSKNERIKICVNVEPEPQIVPLQREPNVRVYMPVNVAAARCGIPNGVLSRITACVFVTPDGSSEKKMRGINIGLNIKFLKKNEEVTGYTRRMDNRWLYSQRCIDLIVDYSAAFPQVFQLLSRHIDYFEDFTEKQLFPDNVGEGKLQDVVEWIKAHPFNKFSIRSCDTVGLEPDELEWLCSTVDEQHSGLQAETKLLRLQVKPSVLFKPNLHSGNIPPDPAAAKYRLYDRVVNVNPNSTVPLGLKGTVTAIVHEKEKTNTVNLSDKLNNEPSFQILFDEPFLGGFNADGVDGNRFYRLLGFNLLNISHGRADYDKANKVQVNIRQAVGDGDGDNRSDSFNNLRANDGHNSAFASYASSTKHQADFQMGNLYGGPPLHPTPAVLQNINKSLQVNSPNVLENDPGTILLKSLLKINETDTKRATASAHENRRGDCFIPNFALPPPPLVMHIGRQSTDSNHLKMMFPNNTPSSHNNRGTDGSNRIDCTANNASRVTAPNNNRVPFPAKLINLDDSPPPQNQRNKKPNENEMSNPTAPISFVPLQAVTKQRSRNLKPKKVFHEIKPVPVPIAPNISNIVANEPTLSTNVQSTPAPVNLNKKKRSRIAANFGQL